jgi:hypothetical protein
MTASRTRAERSGRRRRASQIEHCVVGKPEAARELLLRQAELGAHRLHVDGFGNVHDEPFGGLVAGECTRTTIKADEL